MVVMSNTNDVHVKKLNNQCCDCRMMHLGGTNVLIYVRVLNFLRIHHITNLNRMTYICIQIY